MSSRSHKLSVATMVTEIVSGVAVVITLVLLIGEVRANTDAVRLGTQEAATRNAVELFQYVVTDPDIIESLTSGESISATDSVRARGLSTWVLRVTESQFVLHESGILSEDERRVLRHRNALGLQRFLPWVEERLAECPGCYSAEFQSWLAWIFENPESDVPLT